MSAFRHALLASCALVALAPGTAAAAGPADSSDAVRDVAIDAVHSATDERQLVEAGDRPDELAAVDAEGATLLEKLRQLDVRLTDAIIVTLEAHGDAPAPPTVVYDAAIDDLLRIAATPSAVTPDTTSGTGPSYGLLAVAAISLLVLGAAALANTLRRDDRAAVLATLAWNDSGTGPARRRRLSDHATVPRGPSSVIRVQIDHLAGLADAHGDDVRDDVLRRVAGMLADQVRRGDVVYRYPDSEFCVLLPGASLVDARTVGDRIVAAAHTIDLPDGAAVTVSVGVADGRTGDLTATMAIADRAVSEARRRGHDQVVTVDA